jgi:hypothetical protein
MDKDAKTLLLALDDLVLGASDASWDMRREGLRRRAFDLLRDVRPLIEAAADPQADVSEGDALLAVEAYLEGAVERYKEAEPQTLFRSYGEGRVTALKDAIGVLRRMAADPQAEEDRAVGVEFRRCLKQVLLLGEPAVFGIPITIEGPFPEECSVPVTRGVYIGFGGTPQDAFGDVAEDRAVGAAVRELDALPGEWSIRLRGNCTPENRCYWATDLTALDQENAGTLPELLAKVRAHLAERHAPDPTLEEQLAELGASVTHQLGSMEAGIASTFTVTAENKRESQPYTTHQVPLALAFAAANRKPVPVYSPEAAEATVPTPCGPVVGENLSRFLAAMWAEVAACNGYRSVEAARFLQHLEAALTADAKPSPA